MPRGEGDEERTGSVSDTRGLQWRRVVVTCTYGHECHRLLFGNGANSFRNQKNLGFSTLDRACRRSPCQFSQRLAKSCVLVRRRHTIAEQHQEVVPRNDRAPWLSM